MRTRLDAFGLGLTGRRNIVSSSWLDRMTAPYALFHYDASNHGIHFGAEELASLDGLLRLDHRVRSWTALRRGGPLVARTQVLLTSWGAVPLTGALLDRMPRLQAVFHAGGSVKLLAGDGELFRRGIRLTTANPELAESVAEFTFSLIVLSNRQAWRKIDEWRRLRDCPSRAAGPGNFESTVGLLGYGTIARALRRLLHGLQVRVLVFDPLLSADEARAHGVTRVSLQELFAEADVVSCHLPSLPETAGMVTGALIRSMRRGATFINTARGAVVDEPALAASLAVRTDLWAVLDVLNQEPPAADNPLLALPNVTLTPHIAGCLGRECRRLGRFIVEEVRRWRAGEPLRGEVRAGELAHRA